jgi:flagellar motility protein MotE (MotC chaperone)
VDDDPELGSVAEDDEKLADRIAKARERHGAVGTGCARLRPELLHDIARARNLSQSVDQTALQNLAGKHDLMKQVLAH